MPIYCRPISLKINYMFVMISFRMDCMICRAAVHVYLFIYLYLFLLLIMVIDALHLDKTYACVSFIKVTSCSLSQNVFDKSQERNVFPLFYLQSITLIRGFLASFFHCYIFY